MKETFNKILEYIAKLLVFIVIPFSGIAAIIYYAFTKMSTLKQQLSQKEAENKMQDAILKKEHAKTEADRAVEDYNKVKDKYLKEFGDQ